MGPAIHFDRERVVCAREKGCNRSRAARCGFPDQNSRTTLSVWSRDAPRGSLHLSLSLFVYREREIGVPRARSGCASGTGPHASGFPYQKNDYSRVVDRHAARVSLSLEREREREREIGCEAFADRSSLGSVRRHTSVYKIQEVISRHISNQFGRGRFTKEDLRPNER